jgi:hypothetical protein
MIGWKQLAKEWLEKEVPDENDYQKCEEARDVLIAQAREKVKNEYRRHRTPESTRNAMDEAEKQIKIQIEKAKIEIQRHFLMHQDKQLRALGITPSGKIEDQLKNYHTAVNQNKQAIQAARAAQERAEQEREKKPKQVHFSSDPPKVHVFPSQDNNSEGDNDFSPTVLHAYNKDQTPKPKQQNVVLSEKNTLEDLRKYLKNASNLQKHQITQVQDHKTSIELTMRNDKANSKTHKTYAHEKEGEGILFSIDKNKSLSREAINEAILQTCKLAVMSAKPNTRFDLNVAPEDKKEVLHEAFKVAIQEAIQEGKFNNENAPKVEDTSSMTPRRPRHSS